MGMEADMATLAAGTEHVDNVMDGLADPGNMGPDGTSTAGGSGRAEIGMRMNATKTNPWQADISLYGYAGKHRGFGGNISVAYMF